MSNEILKKLELVRLTTSKSRVQRGVIISEGEPLCLTLELPWRDNEFSLSCIPDGAYICRRDTNRKTSGGLLIPETYEVINVPQRSGILFHVGNVSLDTHGCILLGSKFGYIDSNPAILSSREAFELFIKTLKGVLKFQLEIRWA